MSAASRNRGRVGLSVLMSPPAVNESRHRMDFNPVFLNPQHRFFGPSLTFPGHNDQLFDLISSIPLSLSHARNSASVIGFDVDMTWPDRFGPENVRDLLGCQPARRSTRHRRAPRRGGPPPPA